MSKVSVRARMTPAELKVSTRLDKEIQRHVEATAIVRRLQAREADRGALSLDEAHQLRKAREAMQKIETAWAKRSKKAAKESEKKLARSKSS